MPNKIHSEYTKVLLSKCRESCRLQVKGVPLATAAIQEHPSSILPGQKIQEVPAEEKNMVTHKNPYGHGWCAKVEPHND